LARGPRYVLTRDRTRDLSRIDRDLAEHPADRVRVPDEVDAGCVGMRLRAVHHRPSLLRLEDSEVADQRLEPALEAGAGDDGVGLDARAGGQDHVVALEPRDR